MWPSSTFVPPRALYLSLRDSDCCLTSAVPVRFTVLFTPETVSHYLDPPL